MSETAPRLEPSWLAVLGQEFQQPYMRQLKEFLVEERKRTSVYPPGPEIFNAFAHTPVAKVRVVILGQDRVKKTVSHSETAGADGSSSIADSSVVFGYDAVARLTAATAEIGRAHV